MKISSKLNGFFVLLLLFILLLGYAGIVVQKRLNDNFQKYAGRVLPSAIEAIKMRADIDDVLEYSRLYDMTMLGEYRWKAWSALKNTERDLLLYLEYSNRHIPQQKLKQIDASVRLFCKYARLHLNANNITSNRDNVKFKNLMNIQVLKIRYELKQIIDRDVANTKMTESILEDTTSWSFYLILSVFIASILVFAVALVNINLYIVLPIRRLTNIARVISDGNVDVLIPDTIKKYKNEIAVLAQSFDKMVKYLLELARSRDDLNMAINEREEQQLSLTTVSPRILTHTSTLLLSSYSQHLLGNVQAAIGYSELLNHDALLPEKRKTYLHTIKKTLSESIQLIEDLKLIENIETNTLNIVSEICSLHEIIDDCDQYARKRIEELSKHIKVSVSKAKIIDSLIIDKQSLKQVFIKLIDNSINHSHSGKLQLGYTVSGDEITFYVKDSGTGISDSDLSYAFEKYKHHTSKVLATNNHGFGLAICRGIVHAMGGQIWIERSDQEGITVFFTMMNRFQLSQKAERDFFCDWSNKKILVVDDEEINKVLITECLAKTNALLIFADNGERAIELFREQTFDVVLMDLKMPVMDGYQATRHMSAINPSVPIIANTAYTYLHEKEACFSAGCVDYIAKPFNIKELIKVISKYIT